MEKSQEPPPPPPLPPNPNPNPSVTAHVDNQRRQDSPGVSPSPPSPSGLLVKEDIHKYNRAPSPIRTQMELQRNTNNTNKTSGRDVRRSDDNIVVTANKGALITPTRSSNNSNNRVPTNTSANANQRSDMYVESPPPRAPPQQSKPVLQFKQQKLQPPMASKYGNNQGGIGETGDVSGTGGSMDRDEYAYEQVSPYNTANGNNNNTNDEYDYDYEYCRHGDTCSCAKEATQ